MKNLLISTAAGLSLAAAALVTMTPAQAQVGIEIGPGGVRAYERDVRPVIERRVDRRRVIVEEDDAEECRVEVRRSVNRFGETVTRRVRTCE